MKTTLDKIIEEFREIAYPIVHSNTFPEKDSLYLKRLENFISQKFPAYAKEIVEKAKPKPMAGCFCDKPCEYEPHFAVRNGYLEGVEKYHSNLLKKLKRCQE